MLDTQFGVEQAAVFEADKQQAKEMTLAEWQSCSRPQKMIDSAVALLRSQM